MIAARQRLQRVGRATGARARSTVDDAITVTLSVASEPLKATKTHYGKIQRGLLK